MLDLRFIRNHPKEFDASLARRLHNASSDVILQHDKQHRSLQNDLQRLQEQRKIHAKTIAEYKRNNQDATRLMEEGETLKHRINALEEEVSFTHKKIHDILSSLPNLISPEAPDGASDQDARMIEECGTKRVFDFAPQEHHVLGEKLGMDFAAAAKVCGSRFVYLKGKLARLERALAQFMLDTHIDSGYTEVSVPLLMRENAMFGTGQLPKMEEDLFKTTTGHYLIPTSEVALANIVHDSLLKEEDLPLRFVSCSPCFRSEAGASGRDTTGMIRQHQFYKVELVSITKENESTLEHERMLQSAKRIVDLLELPYRVVVLAAGDTSFCSFKTYDIEVFLPGHGSYREIASCSNCLDFQARRMNTRYKEHDTGKNVYVHTLNSSGLPLGRTLVAILENYQTHDGHITIPSVLRPYMKGETVI